MKPLTENEKKATHILYQIWSKFQGHENLSDYERLMDEVNVAVAYAAGFKDGKDAQTRKGCSARYIPIVRGETGLNPIEALKDIEGSVWDESIAELKELLPELAKQAEEANH